MLPQLVQKVSLTNALAYFVGEPMTKEKKFNDNDTWMLQQIILMFRMTFIKIATTGIVYIVECLYTTLSRLGRFIIKQKYDQRSNTKGW